MPSLNIRYFFTPSASGASHSRVTTPRFAFAVKFLTMAGAASAVKSNEILPSVSLMLFREKYEYLPSLEWVDGIVTSDHVVLPVDPGKGAPAELMSP